MDEPEKPFILWRDWRIALVAIVAAAILLAGIVYKYTGDFTGLATFGTSGKQRSE